MDFVKWKCNDLRTCRAPLLPEIKANRRVISINRCSDTLHFYTVKTLVTKVWVSDIYLAHPTKYDDHRLTGYLATKGFKKNKIIRLAKEF